MEAVNWGALGVALVLLMALTVIVLWAAGIPRRWSQPYAVARGAVQLLAIGLVLRGVITDWRWVGLGLLVMFAVATTTSTRRLGPFEWARWWRVAVAMACGIAVVLAVIALTGAIEVDPRNALAVGGIVVGNSMTIATLTARRLRIGILERWDEVEGWLALGATPRQASAVIAREAAGEALVPTVDQTRTTGLVTLPGAFVGALFGGASPLAAGQFQIVVLACVLTSAAITSALLIRFLGAVRQKPAPL